MNGLLAFLMQRNGYMAEDTGGDGSGGSGGKDDRGDDLPGDKGKGGDEGKGGGDDTDEAEDSIGEETEEEKKERLAEEERAAAAKRIRIPKSRFDEVIQRSKRREAELLGEIERLKGERGAEDRGAELSKAEKALDELQDKYEGLLLDGKGAEAKQVRLEIRKLQTQISEAKTDERLAATRASAVDEVTYNTALSEAEARHPELNPDSDKFDSEVVNEVAALMSSFVKSGSTRAAALRSALHYVFKGSAAPAKGAKAADEAERRAEDARRKAADALRRQPPTGGGKGASDSEAIDVRNMSQDEFAKLKPEQLAKLRGDVL